MHSQIVRCFLECVSQTLNGNLAFRPSGGVLMIRKCYEGEASTSSLLQWNTPISLLIFSGAIVFTAQTIEIVPRIQGEEKCVVRWHKFLLPWRRLQKISRRGSWLIRLRTFYAMYENSLITCVETQWVFHWNRNSAMDKWQQAMTCWQWWLSSAVIIL